MGSYLKPVIFIGLVGAIGIGIITHADGFKTAFGAVGSFFTNEMTLLEGNQPKGG